ncbi:hypothetical protein ElyMa_003195100 [Elysia marginata]|uniref:EGF-like domain-containing protein n=1 Tax=Elysia marginata TaxID=1093978 RepID=A0AAV4J425_9GAST|nr:hypothetical protein ElyMa_003195100 [Elysia marginata]
MGLSRHSQMDTDSHKNDSSDVFYKIILVSSQSSPLPAHIAFTADSSCSISSMRDVHHNNCEQRIPSLTGIAPSHFESDSSSSSLLNMYGPSETKSLTSSWVSPFISERQMPKDNGLLRFPHSHSISKSQGSVSFEHCSVPGKLCPKTGRSPFLTPSSFISGYMPSILLPRPSKVAVVSFLLLVILSLQPELSAARSVGVCRGIPCANGGRLLVSNSIWGNCRCRCPSGFVGPYCQYQAAYKRSGDSAPGQQQSQQEAGSRVSRSQTMEMIRQHLLALAQMQAPSSSGDTAGLSGTEDGDSEELILDNISRREADIGLLALSKLADLSSGDALDGIESPELYRAPPRQHRVWRAKRVALSSLETPWYKR